MPPPTTNTGQTFVSVITDELLYQSALGQHTTTNWIIDSIPPPPTGNSKVGAAQVFSDPGLQSLYDELKMKNKEALIKKKADAANLTVSEYFALHSVGRAANEFVCGIEYEIEAVDYYNFEGVNTPKGLFPVYVTEDGSLKYCGYEFITQPLTYEQHIDVYETLMSKVIKFVPENQRIWEPFNERTSTHVHVNLTWFNPKQVEDLVLLYILLEPLFFANVAEHRKNNIHCVPINDTFLIKNLALKPLDTPILHRLKAADFWHKYSAFNLLPLRKLGTVEFRHLQGASDLETVRNWLRLLAAFYEICVNKDTDIPALVKSFVKNSKMSYTDKINWYFPTLYSFTPKLLERDFQLDMEKSENNIIYILFERG